MKRNWGQSEPEIWESVIGETQNVEVAPGTQDGAWRARGGVLGAEPDPAPKCRSANRQKDAVVRRLRSEPMEALSQGLGVEKIRREAYRETALSSICVA